ncbi:MAG: extracellular solute-binding protein [Roseburia sp.]|nr:extracellular solute-binding protein [Roseburia sp.]
MKQSKRILRVFCLLLTLALSVGCLMVFTSCSGKNDSGTGTTPPTQGTNGGTNNDPVKNPDTGDTTEEERYLPAAKDFGEGNNPYEYRMLVTTNSLYQNTYIYDGEGTPKEICDYALWCREKLMLEKYNIELTINNVGSEGYAQLSNNVTAGSADFCQVAMLNGTDSISAAVNGYLLNLNSMDEFNLEASYWDQRIQQEYRINDYLFTLDGDFNYIDDLRTYVVIYNNTAYDSFNYREKYGTPYSLAAEGKWTYAMMMEMIKDISYEVDGNSTMNENDFWGMVSETSVPFYFFLGSGLKFMTNNSGTLSFDGVDDASIWETNYNTLETLMSMASNPDVLIANRDLSGDVWTLASDIFQQNRALFRTTTLSATMRLIDMKDNYGIMPIPAYTEGQDGYYCWVQAGEHRPLTIPRSVADSSKAALASEYLAYHSRYDGGDSLYYAFYDLLAYARLCRTPDDKAMLELVFANKTFDIDAAAKLSGISGKVQNIVSSKNYTTLSSELNSIRSSVTQQVQQFTVDVVTKCPNP